MRFSWQTWLTIGAAAQLAVVAAFSILSRAKFPKKGLRRTEQLLLASAIVAAIASLATLDLHALWRGQSRTVQASAASAPAVSCVTVEPGMAESEVTRRLGAPDRRLSDEETRGPGAAVLVYERSRCAVHVLDGRVELVD